MPVLRQIGVEERRSRLVLRHHLARGTRADGVADVARDLVALHSTDPASVYLSIAARLGRPDLGSIERALYDDRVLVRMLGMRRTVFVVPVELVAVIQASSTRAIAVQERRRTLQLLEQSGLGGDTAAWLRDVEKSTLAALAARGEATAADLSEDEPRLRHKILLAEGKNYESNPSINTRVLFVLAADGRIVRGRPRGSWTSSQYRWSLVETWLPGGIEELSVAAAQARLVDRWLFAFGPGTVADLRWWTGWAAADVKRALAAVGAVEVDLDGATGLTLADDLDVTPAVEESIALLPALDPTPMGWSGRAWYLGAHTSALFDRSGNIGPTVWLGGRIVGGWAQRKDGAIAFRLLEDIGGAATTAVGDEAEQLGAWLGETRLVPRGRLATPLERDLLG